MQEELKEKDILRFSTAEAELGGEFVAETLDAEQVCEDSSEIPVAERNTCEDAEHKLKLKASSISDPNVGKIVDKRYRLLENVGKGGSSSVYRARELDSNRIVALKVLHSHLVSDDFIVERFKREADTSKFLQHPNVIDVESWAVSEDGQVYMTAEFVDGISLQEAIEETKSLSVRFTLGIMAQVCSALAAAHEKGVVHCDLKPGNIMLTRSPDDKLIVKVLDFGIAKILPVTGDTVLRLTQSGGMLGSLLYMSPEQCLDQVLDARSDVYSLGCVMYEALTGKPPICARTAFETMNKHMTEMPAPLRAVRADVQWPKKLEEILRRAYAKKPEDRYQSIVEFQSALQKLDEMSAEIRWPERWSKKSILVEADVKENAVDTSRAVSSKVPSEITRTTTSTVDPQQVIYSLTKEIGNAMPVNILPLVAFAAGFAFAAYKLVSLPGFSHNVAFCVLALAQFVAALFFSLLLISQWSYSWKFRKIDVIRKSGFRQAPAMVASLTARPISVLKVAKSSLEHYMVKFELTEPDGKVTLQELCVRRCGLGPTWVISESQHFSSRSDLRMPLASPEITWDPMPGSLFFDADGQPMAISILHDIGWISSREIAPGDS